MNRKDDPVQNVSFVQLVETHPCLWKSDESTYSKKDEIYKAWQEVASKTHDTVRNCRERWRTIRSSFQRSMKMSHTNTGRRKRKYYLSKYLEFLQPYTNTRTKSGPLKVPNSGTNQAENIPAQISVKKTSTMTSQPPPLSLMTRSSAAQKLLTPPLQPAQPQIRMSQQKLITPPMTSVNLSSSLFEETPVLTTDDSKDSHTDRPIPEYGGDGRSIKMERDTLRVQQEHPPCANHTPTATNSQASVELNELAEWIKRCNPPPPQLCTGVNNIIPNQLETDSDQLFLNSLHQYLKEMTSKQNRQFRQRVMALVDDLLEDKN